MSSFSERRQRLAFTYLTRRGDMWVAIAIIVVAIAIYAAVFDLTNDGEEGWDG